MPPFGEEVCLTELEIQILAPFIKKKILNDAEIIKVLKILSDKLEGSHGKTDVTS